MERTNSISSIALTDAELRVWAPDGYYEHGFDCLNGCVADDLHAGEIVRHLKQEAYPVIGSDAFGKELTTPDHHIITLSPKEKEKLKDKYVEALDRNYIAGIVISTEPPTVTKWFLLNTKAPAQPERDHLFQVDDKVDGARWYPRHFNTKRTRTGRIKDTRVGVEEPKLFHIKTLHKMPWKDQARAKLEDCSLGRLLIEIYEIYHRRNPPVQYPFPAIYVLEN